MTDVMATRAEVTDARAVGKPMLISGCLRIVGSARDVSWGDIGPYVLAPHASIGLGVRALGAPMAWTISGLWGSDFDPGIGPTSAC